MTKFESCIVHCNTYPKQYLQYNNTIQPFSMSILLEFFEKNIYYLAFYNNIYHDIKVKKYTYVHKIKRLN